MYVYQHVIISIRTYISGIWMRVYTCIYMHTYIPIYICIFIYTYILWEAPAARDCNSSFRDARAKSYTHVNIYIYIYRYRSLLLYVYIYISFIIIGYW